MRDYIAWLNGASVARGTLAHVRAEARKVFESEAWQTWEAPKGPTKFRVTRGARQYFVTAEEWKA